jgi:hypothetical protein
MDKVMIFLIATVLIIVVVLGLALPRLLRNNKANAKIANQSRKLNKGNDNKP